MLTRADRFNLFIHIGSPVFFISAGYLTAIASAMYAISNRKVEALGPSKPPEHPRSPPL